MGMPRKAGLLFLAAGLVTGGCQANTTSERPGVEAREVGPSEPASFETRSGPKPEGHFYAVVGEETSSDSWLYELSLVPPDLRLLTGTNRVSAVGGCPDLVVVAAGQPEVGFSDHIQRLERGVLSPLDGLGSTEGSSPALHGDCRVAYTWVDRSTEANVKELRVWDPTAKEGKTLYRGEPGDGPLVSVAWGQDGELVVVRQGPDQAGQLPAGTPTGRPAALIIVQPDGTVTEIGMDGVPGVAAWGRDWIATGMNDRPSTVFVNPTTEARSTLEGWRPLAWSPTGDRLLVKDATERRTLGVVEASDLSSVRTVGRASGPVIDLDWLPAQ